MTAHLLALELGPVAGFIAAARKTRDLWFGSWLLSELAKATARAVRAQRGELIFPAPASDADLEPGSELTVADTILAELPAGLDPKVVAAAAKAAAHAAWIEHAEDARRGLGEFIRADIWNDQTPTHVPPDTAGEVVECYAAWVPLVGEYKDCRRQVMRLLAGRTACRNFPPAKGKAGVPKSSLDGARETVFKELKPGPAERRASRLRLNRGELLDAPGVVKRRGGDPERYPSIARVAADPWVRGAAAHAAGPFARLTEQCEQLVRDKVVTRVSMGTFAAFPFEGAVLYPSRHADLVDEYGADTSEDAAAVRGRLRTADRLRAACGRGEPHPYYAVLVADGDRVGRALDGCHDPGAHREFSRALAAFAAAARDTIARHQGASVFVGGDDVLAFLPVDRALKCADALRTAFAKVWAGVTLSVGLAIAHFLDPLEDVLRWARDAEHAAKGTRDALAVHHQPRGGSPIVVRRPWAADPAAEFHRFADHLRRGELPDKVAYDLRTLADEYTHWPDTESTADAIRRDAARMLRRKQGSSAAIFGDLLGGVRRSADLIDLANVAIIARRIAAAVEQAGEGP